MSTLSLFASLGAAFQSFSSHRSSCKVSVPVAKSNPNLISAFERDLASRLEQLRSADETEYLSIEWLCQAMEMVLSTHSFAELTASDFDQVVSNGHGKWIDSFMDNSVKLLDTCVVLKAALAEIKSYIGHLNVALRALEKDPIGEIEVKRCMNALKQCSNALNRKDVAVHHLAQRRSKAESCSSMLRKMAERLNAEDSSKGDFFMAIYAAQVVTIFVCSLLSNVLTLSSRWSLLTISRSGHSSWFSSFNTLQKKVKELIEKKKSNDRNALLMELDMAEIAVRNSHNVLPKIMHANASSDKRTQILKVKKSAKVLQAVFVDLQQGIPTLESHLENIHGNLLRTRMAFLDMDHGSY
ncbi:hypothetical protein KP509_22G029600 [Ceratopteris richardii]|uniref:Uncharacterized protein n=1 Tax=Ceratopteris richardii TaxID=49495 RepID=A0A8T2S5R1_CERRI|nr:hypothetical protein KP509_22G029600 [Ceratopteris richardii]